MIGTLVIAAMTCRDASLAPLGVLVDPSHTVVKSFKGLGIQVDPYEYEPSPEQWKTVWNRLDYCRPGLFRCVFQANTYCEGFDSAGEPIYAWAVDPSSAKLRQVEAILDYAQRHDVEVLIGEWGPPRFEGGLRLKPGDPRWARITSDWIRHLVIEKGYRCIKAVDFLNEPNGDWSGNESFDTWAEGIRKLGPALSSAKLPPVSIPGTTGTSEWPEGLDWLERSAKEVGHFAGSYNLHWYAMDREVLEGRIERILREKRKATVAIDPEAKGKPFFIGEAGIVEGRTNGDQQPRVKSFEYGVLMADYAAQVARAGYCGLVFWDLDDAMHTNDAYVVPPGPRTLKIWGFWNTQGKAMGHPGDEAMRPPFYTWSLMSRLFPKGARIVRCDGPGAERMRSLAAMGSNGLLSIMVVNDRDEPASVTVRVGSVGRRTLYEYRYFEHDRTTDRNGFAAVAAIHPSVALSKGVTAELPGRGVLFLTTRPD